jgi:hypothetical protein
MAGKKKKKGKKKKGRGQVQIPERGRTKPEDIRVPR